jgi:hypothetical protein
VFPHNLLHTSVFYIFPYFFVFCLLSIDIILPYPSDFPRHFPSVHLSNVCIFSTDYCAHLHPPHSHWTFFVYNVILRLVLKFYRLSYFSASLLAAYCTLSHAMPCLIYIRCVKFLVSAKAHFTMPRFSSFPSVKYLMCVCTLGCFVNTCSCIYCVLYCLYCVLCTVSFMYIYSYLFCLYWCKDYGHRVTIQLQLIIIIIIMH